MLSYLLSMLDNEEDRAFMAALFEAHRDLMFTVARKIVGHNETAEDVVQDALVRLLDKVPLLRTLESRQQTAYLAAAARNGARNQVRRERRRRECVWDEADSVPAAALRADDATERWVETLLLEQESYLAFRRAWATLDNLTRELLERRFLLRESYHALALRFGVTDNAARGMVERAAQRAIFAEPPEAAILPPYLRLVK